MEPFVKHSSLLLQPEFLLDQGHIRLEHPETALTCFRHCIGLLMPAGLPDQKFKCHGDIRVRMPQSAVE